MPHLSVKTSHNDLAQTASRQGELRQEGGHGGKLGGAEAQALPWIAHRELAARAQGQKNGNLPTAQETAGKTATPSQEKEAGVPEQGVTSVQKQRAKPHTERRGHASCQHLGW